MQKKQEDTTKATIHQTVRQYYGNFAMAAESPLSCGCVSEDSACCQPDQDSTLDIGAKAYDKEALEALPSDITNMSLGCGDPVTLAALLPGQTVVDLGSGGGIDCFLAAGKVGPTGKVIGIDMTSEMIDRAKANQKKLGIEYVEFRQGEIENIPLEDDCIDVIISNCVINLSPDKPKVFQEAYRILKPGGKLAVSDIVTDGHLPESVMNDLTAWASCLSGALDVADLIEIMHSTGFVEIDVQPYYWDAEIFQSFRQPDLPGKAGLDQNHAHYELSELQAAIFSAKITAFKPEN